jgi:uncharacterized membrane protein YtjA (UPF0391 family)
VSVDAGRIADITGIAMWCYAAALFGIVVIAEALGLGGIPAQAVEIENILFIVLLAAFVVMAFKQIMRH